MKANSKSIKNSSDVSSGYGLYDYQTGEYLRPATEDELRASMAASEHDGGAGVILVEGFSCYVL